MIAVIASGGRGLIGWLDGCALIRDEATTTREVLLATTHGLLKGMVRSVVSEGRCHRQLRDIHGATRLLTWVPQAPTTDGS